MTTRRPSKRAWLLTGAAWLGFALVTALTATGTLDALDRRLALRPLDPLSAPGQIAAAFAIATLPVVLYAVLLGFAMLSRHHRLRSLSVAMLLAVALGWGGDWIWKLLIDRDRPQAPVPLISAQGASYPSGHVTAVTVLTVMLVAHMVTTRMDRRAAKLWAWGGVGLVLLVGLDRLLLSAHWLSDLVGGLFWGLAASCTALLVAGVKVLPRAAAANTSSRATSGTCAVIYNPSKVTDWLSFRRRVEHELDRHGMTPLWLETTRADPGREMTRRALDLEVDLVLGAGGDGTIRVICDELAGSGVPFGLIPAGTGNLLARNLGIPLDEVSALRTALEGRTRPIDLVRLTDEHGHSEHFTVMAGIGIDAVIMDATNADLKKAVGSAAYFVAAAQQARHPAVQATLQLDDEPPFTRRASVIVIGNVGFLQGGIPLLPDASADDGLLDVVVASPRSARDWLRITTRVLARKDRAEEQLDRLRGSRLTLTVDRSEPYQMDGDTVGRARQLTAEIRPGALQLRMP